MELIKLDQVRECPWNDQNAKRRRVPTRLELSPRKTEQNQPALLKKSNWVSFFNLLFRFYIESKTFMFSNDYMIVQLHGNLRLKFPNFTINRALASVTFSGIQDRHHSRMSLQAIKSRKAPQLA